MDIECKICRRKPKGMLYAGKCLDCKKSGKKLGGLSVLTQKIVVNLGNHRQIHIPIDKKPFVTKYCLVSDLHPYECGGIQESCKNCIL